MRVLQMLRTLLQRPIEVLTGGSMLTLGYMSTKGNHGAIILFLAMFVALILPHRD